MVVPLIVIGEGFREKIMNSVWGMLSLRFFLDIQLKSLKDNWICEIGGQQRD